MATITINLPRPHAAQRQVLDSDARFVVLFAGRRFGKTEMVKMRGIELALAGRRWWYVALSNDNVAEMWDWLASAFSACPAQVADVSHQRREIALANGGLIGVKSALKLQRMRGVGLDWLFIDEAAFIHRGRYVWQNILQPTLLDRRGGAWLMSSPNGHDWLQELWDAATRRPGWAAFRFASHDNPAIDAGELARIRDEIPERVWQQEYLALTLADGGVFRNIDACVSESLPRARGRQGARHVIGVDLGRQRDYTVFVAIDPDTREVVAIDRFSDVDYTLQLQRLIAFCERFTPRAVVIESNIERTFFELARSASLPVVAFATTAASKPLAISALALALEQRAIALPDDPALLGELRAFESSRAPSGATRYSAPPGAHDDMVMALAIAWYHLTRGYVIEPFSLERF